MMDKIIKPIADLILPIVDKYGTKFVVCLGADWGLLELAMKDKVEGWQSLIAISAVTIAYFISRNKQEFTKVKEKP